MMLTEAEQRFLASQHHGHLATMARGGTPQVKPVGFSYNPRLGTIDIGGLDMAHSAKYKNVQANPEVAFVADDVPDPEGGPAGARFLEIRGVAETVTGPPDPAGHQAPDIIRIHPRRLLAYNVDPDRPGLQTRDAPDEDLADTSENTRRDLGVSAWRESAPRTPREHRGCSGVRGTARQAAPLGRGRRPRTTSPSRVVPVPPPG